MLVLHEKFHIVSTAVYKALQPFPYCSGLSCLCCLQIFKTKKFLVALCSCHLLSSPSLNTMTDQNQYATVLQYSTLSHSSIYVVFGFIFF